MSGAVRILVLNLRDITSPNAGGAEVHLHELFRRLAARGHPVTLHSGRYRRGRPEEWVDGIRVVRRGNRLTNAAWSMAYYLKFRKEFDLVVDYTCQLHFLTPLYARLPRVAMALHIVGDVYTHDLPFPIGHLLAAWEAFSLRFFYGKEQFVAISESTAAELRRHGIPSQRIKVVPGGRREPAPPRCAKTEYPSLLYYGRLKGYKGVDRLIAALPAIRAAVPATRLHVVGTGDALGSLKRLTRQLNLEEAVTFHGWLPDAERWPVVASAWVNVQPSLKEGWPLAVMEAAQCGVPTLASRAPGLRDVVLPGETGEIFDRDDRAGLVRHAVRLLSDTEARQRLGRAAMARANRFSWDDASVELEQVLKRCAAREGSERYVAVGQ
jgi:glycosyltransferase involved in cell wall biosynthesis